MLLVLSTVSEPSFSGTFGRQEKSLLFIFKTEIEMESRADIIKLSKILKKNSVRI